MKVGKDTVVTVDYELHLDDGRLLESTLETRRPFIFYFGRSSVLPAIEEALEGKEEGDEVEVVLPPEKAYGPVLEEAIYDVPRSQFPPGTELEVGSTMMMETPQGEQYPFRIADVTEDQVKVDFNHPLAGRTLYFKLRVKGVRELTPDELLSMASSEGSEREGLA